MKPNYYGTDYLRKRQQGQSRSIRWLKQTLKQHAKKNVENLITTFNKHIGLMISRPESKKKEIWKNN